MNKFGKTLTATALISIVALPLIATVSPDTKGTVTNGVQDSNSWAYHKNTV